MRQVWQPEASVLPGWAKAEIGEKRPIRSDIIKNVLENKKNLLVVAVAKIVVDQTMEVLELAGLDPVGLEIESIAQARSLLLEKNEKETILIIDIGDRRTSFSVTKGGVTCFTSSIPLCGQSLTEVISKRMDITFEEAEKNVRGTIERLLTIQGNKSVDQYHKELGKIMWDYCGMARTAEGLTKAKQMVKELREEFWKNVRVTGKSGELNQDLEKAWRVADFFELGELMINDALNRNESCGGHFRVEFQDAGEARRDDSKYAYVAAWQFQGIDNEPVMHKEELVFENIKLAVRSYK